MPDRKYRHRGYQEGAGRSGGAGGGPFDDRPQRLEGAPKGRGADRDRADVFRCKSCGERNDAEAVSASATCRKCGTALHACAQCRHFDTAAPNQCKKPIPQAILKKSAANECAFYEPTIALDLKGKTSLDTPDQARSAFDKLFGKK